LTCFRQAVLGLRWFRQGVDVTALARDHGISRATGYRYLDEIIDVLADQAPDLHEALEKAKADGLACVILDGKIFSADRCSEKPRVSKRNRSTCGTPDRPTSTAERASGLRAGRVPLWVADVEPGSIHDLTVAREHVLGALYRAGSHLDLPTLSDGGYEGAGIGLRTPIKPAGDQVLDVDNRTYNALLHGLRCLGERGFAVLTGRWRTLHHITPAPARSATSSKPPSSSPISNTADSPESW
jgi:hypothetical protein